jgi:hypothetical protein
MAPTQPPASRLRMAPMCASAGGPGVDSAAAAPSEPQLKAAAPAGGPYPPLRVAAPGRGDV